MPVPQPHQPRSGQPAPEFGQQVRVEGRRRFCEAQPLALSWKESKLHHNRPAKGCLANHGEAPFTVRVTS